VIGLQLDELNQFFNALDLSPFHKKTSAPTGGVHRHLRAGSTDPMKHKHCALICKIASEEQADLSEFIHERINNGVYTTISIRQACANRFSAGSHPPTWTRTDVSAPLRAIVF
jgi:hypothetical protein